MKKRIDITIKCDNEEKAADALETIAHQLRNAKFSGAPNDLRELENDDGSVFGFTYDVSENDGTDMYGNEIAKGGLK